MTDDELRQAVTQKVYELNELLMRAADMKVQSRVDTFTIQEGLGKIDRSVVRVELMRYL